ncbi:hypothetical protein [Pseudactinotalea terrae]|uniref:hypothetical protein n=1 Tax=Pseudactinotalea terrae TaxID=1743262 RepID=UPI0012E24F10|nr:hypothetical protein [Pseudactinotalea terrae]
MTNPYAPPDPTKPRPPRQQPPQGQWQKRPPQRAQEPPPELTPEQVRSVTGSTMLFGLMMMATLLAGNLPVPWQLLAPLVGVGTLVFGVRTLGRVRKLRWPGMLSPMLIGGLMLTCLTTVGTTTQLTIYWDEQVAYQECRERAVTITAQERCDQEWDEARNLARS